MRPARGYFDRGGGGGGGVGGPFGADGPPPGIFGGGGMGVGMPGGAGGGFGSDFARNRGGMDGPPPGIFGGGGIMGDRGAPATSAAARAAEARAAAAAAAGDELGQGADMVQDAVTGETRPAAAQGRVERLDGGGEEGDLWRGMQGMGMGGGGYQAQGRGAYYGNRPAGNPASNPYYEVCVNRSYV